ncbi:hypothetical protein SCLCIDRAFT_28805 [Scleroderma citrinum Foug A]|uniref:Uncharacterized protein n=1 Tax=Scleroderma citrinum Foug A TaxID=1036808 RepID=A0A0C2Z619_9AGAM|nr:hypothetical protein SCLCIDRAFT_28805 [Scleroderma citrinum Foug A]
MSQQETSAKPSRPASLEIDEHEGNDIQVNDEGMGHNEEREATERTEMAERCNEASKAMESSMRRKMHEKGKNPSLKRYMTCDIALQVLPPAKKQCPLPVSANHHPHHISGVLHWEHNHPSTQPISAPRHLKSPFPHLQPTITYNPYGGLEDDPPNVADMQAEEIDVLMNLVSSHSPVQCVHPCASPLIQITHKSGPWYH